MLDLGRLSQLPHQRMFASPRADDEKLHCAERVRVLRCRAGGELGELAGEMGERARTDFAATPQRGTSDLILSYPLSLAANTLPPSSAPPPLRPARSPPPRPPRPQYNII